MPPTTNGWTEAEAREEEFREDLERRYREDPAWWKWYEDKQRAKRKQKRETDDT